MEIGLNSMLKVNSLIKNSVFSPRFFLIKREAKDTCEFPLNEKYRDLMSLIICLYYIECQEPTRKEIVLKTHFVKDFDSIKKDLESLYYNLTNRSLKINFASRSQTGSQETLDHIKPRDLVLFSGGVDSISGAVKTVSDDPNSVMIHVVSSNRVYGRVKKLINDFFTGTDIFCINARIKSRRHWSYISDTRGLLFLTSGYVVSRFLKSHRLVFCENGAQMLDALLESNAYNITKATKNTDFRYLTSIEELLSRFDDNRFSVNYVFKDKTKSELISKYVSEDLIDYSWSCYSSRGRINMCGFCWNCFITRMSALAAGVNADYLHYKHNPLLETIPSLMYSDNQNIIYDMLVFYEKAINQNPVATNELSRFEDTFRNPQALATRFGLDLFLGINSLLTRLRKTNGLGKKARELLGKIDPFLLEERKEQLTKLRNPVD